MAGAATAVALVAGAGTSSAMFVDYLADRAKLRAYAAATRKPAEETRHQEKTVAAAPIKTAVAAPVKTTVAAPVKTAAAVPVKTAAAVPVRTAAAVPTRIAPETPEPEAAGSAASVALAAKAAASAGSLPGVPMPGPGRIPPSAEAPGVAQHDETAMLESPGIEPEVEVGAGEVDFDDDTFTGAIPVPRPADDEAVVAAAPDGGEAAEPKPAPKKAGRIAKVLKYVNLRSRPTDESKVLTVVPAEAKVNVLSCRSWCEVNYRGTKGFIYKNFIGKS